ncbi:MAG: VOC family protein [Chloroflexota bacterium]
MNRFVHFELATDDFEKTVSFYRDVFGWQFSKYEGPVEYWLITTGEEGTPGINGGLMPAGGEFRGTINTIEVDNIDTAIDKAVSHGGQVVLEKQAIPGVGYQVYVKDPTGIIVGLHQADTSAGLGG